MSKEIKLADIILEQTCSAYPEQYDAFIKDAFVKEGSEYKQIGYLRLRHGYFSVEYPTCGGELVYEAETDGDGMFEDDERDLHLQLAKEALIQRHSL